MTPPSGGGSDAYDVIVVGVGAMGAAVCHELARRGRRVLGLDRFDIPNAMGSSHGDSRAMRLCYYEHPDYVPLLRRAHAMWRSLDDAGGDIVFDRCGALYMGLPETELISGSIESAQRHDLGHELLEHAALQRRFPQFRLPGGFVGVYEPDGGLLRPELAITRWVGLARDLGADIRARSRVEGWEADDSGVVVRLDGSVVNAGSLVLTTGAWSAGVVGDIGMPLTVTRNPLGWIETRDPSLFTGDRFPVWGIEEPTGGFFYGFPVIPGRAGLKIARHGGGAVATADALDREVHETDRADVRAAARRLLHGADGDVLSMHVCMYTNTSDMHFWLDHHPHARNVVVAAGFSGHGFKFAPVVGEAVADLVLEGGTDLPIGFLGTRRRNGVA